MNTTWSSTVKDNQFVVAKNICYWDDNTPQVARGFKQFWPTVTNWKAINGYYYNEKQVSWYNCIVVAGDVMYTFDWTIYTSIKTGLTEWWQRDFMQYKDIVYMCDWINNYASRNGTTYTEYSGQPKCKYLTMIGDRLYGAWETANPNTLYYTAPVPTNWNTINTNTVLIWGDDFWTINIIAWVGNIICVVKSDKAYYVDVVNKSAQPVDWQTWGYANRTFAEINTGIVFLSARGLDTLKAKQGNANGNVLEQVSLTADLQSFTKKIKETSRNSSCWYYSPLLQRYYRSFDTTGDNINDTTLVYDTRLDARTEYTVPSATVFWKFTQDGITKIVCASWNSLYEIENSYTHNWYDPVVELKTKEYNQKSQNLKTYEQTIIEWYMTKNTTLSIDVMDWDNVLQNAKVQWSTLTTTTTWGLWVYPLWLYPLWWPTDTVDMYWFKCIINMYEFWEQVSLRFTSTGGFRAIERYSISYEEESNNISYLSDQY